MTEKFERLIEGIVDKTGCKSDFVGDDDSPEYHLVFQVEEDPSRKQEINVWPFEEDGKHFIRMLTYIGKRQDFSANKLISFLELNMSLRFGAVAIFQGQVVMVSTASFESVIDEDKIISHMKYVIRMADSFERTMIGLDRK